MASIQSRTMRTVRARSPGPAVTHGEILTAIGRSLQRVYAPMLEAPLPDHLVQFVTKIEQREPGAKH
jgi:hypothetical protein